MGTQQLLLLVIGFIVVVLMIYAGTAMYNSYAENANRETLISTITILASNAQQYYRKPQSTGGGGQSFDGWQMPENFETVDFGTFKAKIRNNRVNLTAKGVEPGYEQDEMVKVNAVVYESSVDIVIKN